VPKKSVIYIEIVGRLSFFQMDETAPHSQKVLWKKPKCYLQPNLHCHDYLLLNVVDDATLVIFIINLKIGEL
jgi:hypothetical protein